MLLYWCPYNFHDLNENAPINVKTFHHFYTQGLLSTFDTDCVQFACYCSCYSSSWCLASEGVYDNIWLPQKSIRVCSKLNECSHCLGDVRFKGRVSSPKWSFSVGVQSRQTKFSISLTKHFEHLGGITLGACKKKTNPSRSWTTWSFFGWFTDGLLKDDKILIQIS